MKWLHARFRLAALVIATVATLPAAEFWVAPGGKDEDAGTKGNPFATPRRARDAVRVLKAGGDPTEPITVFFRQGTYFLTQPLALEPQDSGTERFPVTWASAPGESAVLSGGRELSGLVEDATPEGLRRWRTHLPEVKKGDWTFRQLWATPIGAPAYTRRYRPHVGMKRVAGRTYSPQRVAAPHRAAQIDFEFFPGDFRRWSNPADIEVVVLHVWASSRLLVSNIDLERNVVTFTGMPTFAVDQGGMNPYYIENVKEELKESGQWYLDRPTGEFTYLPHPNETLANTRLVAPFLPRILVAQGDFAKGRPVHDVTFRELGFSHSEMPLPPEGYGGSQGAPDLIGAALLQGADRFTFLGCTLSHVGSYAVEIGLGSHGNRLVGCLITDLGGGGVKVGDPNLKKTARGVEVPADNLVENCVIEDGGLLYLSANAVWGGLTRELRIRHNEISRFAYTGVAVGWSWEDDATSCASNLIERNRIHDVLTLLADGGSIYTLGRQPGTVIRGNVVRDNPRGPFTKEDWQIGLYLDQGSSDMLVEDNLLWKTGTHGFKINGGSRNLVRNNVLGPVYGNHAPYLDSAEQRAAHGNLFTGNVLFMDSVRMIEKAWPASLQLMRSNLYHHLGGSNLSWAGKDFASWQATGQDEGSLVTDPLFVDPGGGDFSLKPGSPAATVGFRSFDVRKAGLEASWISLRSPVAATRNPVYGLKPPAEDSRPPDFSFDFEDVPVGRVPLAFAASRMGSNWRFEVVEGGAFRGRRSLRITDSRSAPRNFYPYLNCQPGTPVLKGKFEFSCAFRNDRHAPLMLEIGFRDMTRRGNASAPFTSSPSVQFLANGKVEVGSRTVTSVPAGNWATLKYAVDLGAREAVIKVEGDGIPTGELAVSLPPDFTAFSWFGIVAGDSVDGAAFLDDVKLTTRP